MNAYYSEELFSSKGSEDLTPGIARLTGELILIEPLSDCEPESIELAGEDIVALVEIYAHLFETGESQRIIDALNRGMEISAKKVGID